MLLAISAVWSFRDGKAQPTIGGQTTIPEAGKYGPRIVAIPAAETEFLTAATWALSEKRNAPAVKPIASIGVGAAALLAEEIELRTLGGAVDLDLTEREWAVLAGATLSTQAVRHAYEAEIAVATLTEEGRGRLEIPEYVDAGAALRTEFYSTLLKELGASTAVEVVRKLNRQLEARFAGFGSAVQTLDFSTDGMTTENAQQIGSVTRTVVLWNESDAHEASRTVRETIFPELEDPDGLQWKPLLARLEMAQGKKARG